MLACEFETEAMRPHPPVHAERAQPLSMERVSINCVFQRRNHRYGTNCAQTLPPECTHGTHSPSPWHGEGPRESQSRPGGEVDDKNRQSLNGEGPRLGSSVHFFTSLSRRVPPSPFMERGDRGVRFVGGICKWICAEPSRPHGAPCRRRIDGS